MEFKSRKFLIRNQCSISPTLKASPPQFHSKKMTIITNKDEENPMPFNSAELSPYQYFRLKDLWDGETVNWKGKKLCEIRNN